MTTTKKQYEYTKVEPDNTTSAQTVYADGVAIHDSGALLFLWGDSDDTLQVELAIAHGQWTEFWVSE